MKRIILIGNGFDLAHELKTGYSDFINNFWRNKAETVLKKYINDAMPSVNSTYNIEFDFVDEDITIKDIRIIRNFNLSSDIEKKGYEYFLHILSLISGHKKYSLNIHNLFLEEISNKTLQNWVDIEYEYYLALINCVNNKRKYGIEKLNTDFSQITKFLYVYLLEEQNNRVPLLNKIKEIFVSIIKPIEVRGSYSNNLDDSILIMNFNYTNTVDKYLENYFLFCKEGVEQIHIHGQINDINNPIIFGYGDELDEKYRQIENLNDNRYFKNIKSLMYSKTRNYKNFLSFIESGNYEVFILGHSCGISDKTLLNTLFEHQNCSSIKIYYHKREDGIDNFFDVYSNLSRNFNNKPLMRRIVANQQDSEPLL
jgi:hypothetical protein